MKKKAKKQQPSEKALRGKAQNSASLEGLKGMLEEVSLGKFKNVFSGESAINLVAGEETKINKSPVPRNSVGELSNCYSVQTNLESQSLQDRFGNMSFVRLLQDPHASVIYDN